MDKVAQGFGEILAIIKLKYGEERNVKLEKNALLTWQP